MKKTLLTTLILTVLFTASCTHNSSEAPVVEAPANIEAEVLSPEAATEYAEAQAVAAEAQAALEAELEGWVLETLVSGSFEGIAPGHDSKGGVTIKDNGENVIIELAEDFSSDVGPDLYVILTQEQTVTGVDPVQLDTSKIVKVAPLVDLAGGQSYEISKAEFEANGYAVAIWCNEFNVVFGAAVLK